MKNEAIKKNLFWILAGVGTFFALLAVLFVLTNAGQAIEVKTKEIEAKRDEAKKTTPKGTQAEKDYVEQKKILEAQKIKLWKANYDNQKKLFTWPRNAQLQQMEAKYLKFGEPLPNTDSMDEIRKKDVYEAAYERAAADVRPTKFNNDNWRTVLRHVSDWTVKRPSSWQVWLALEDLWIQRSLLEPIRMVSAEAAKFNKVPNDKDEPESPLNATFQSRVWKLHLKVPTTGPMANRVIEARLQNLSDRLQHTGLRNALRFRVWLDDRPDTQPMIYRIESDFVKAGATVEVKQSFPPDAQAPDRAKAKKEGQLVELRLIPSQYYHGIPPGYEAKKIVKVEQILDERTVPVRTIAAIELGKKDARHSPAGLKPPKNFDAAVLAAATPPTGAMGPGAAGLGGGAGPGEGSPDGGGGMNLGGPGGMGGASGGMRGRTGTPITVLDRNVNRYLEVSDQVRRMPVAVLLVVDQMFMQDTLVAYANSPLRFQITQYHWKRFRGSLASLSPTGAFDEDAPAGAPPGGDPGEGSGDGGAGSRGGVPGSPGGGDAGSPDGGGYGSYGGPSGGSGDGMRGPPGMPGMPGMPGYGGGSGGTLSEGQLTSGLVELTIYGVVTLYERYEDKSAEGTPTTPPTTTPDGQPVPPSAPPTGSQPAVPSAPPTGTPTTPPPGNSTPPMNPMPPTNPPTPGKD